MQRRTFLERAAALVAAPTILHAADKAESKNPLLGFDDYKYECVHNWGRLPSNMRPGRPRTASPSMPPV